MSWFDVSIVVFVVIGFVLQIIRQAFYRSLIRRQVLAEQNIPPNNNIDDEIAPVTFIWHLLDEYNIPYISTVLPTFLGIPSSLRNNNNTAAAVANNNNNNNIV